MFSTLKRALAAGAAALVLATPAVAPANTLTKTYTTSMTETDPASTYAYFAGTLRLSVSSDGIVTGWYLPESNPMFIPVSGSYKDGRYWLTFGSGNFQLNAVRQSDGSIVGSAIQLSTSRAYPATFDFVAHPSA